MADAVKPVSIGLITEDVCLTFFRRVLGCDQTFGLM